jgi:hypothetical protein
MTLNEQIEKRVYEKLRAFDGMELGGNEAVSGSIASVLSEGEVLADDGEQYSSIQDAVDASDGWTFVGPGQFYENVVIDNDDFTLKGAGYDTLIDGGDVDSAITVTSNSSNIKSLRVQTSESSTNTAVYISGSENNIESITVSKSGHTAITFAGNNNTAFGCTIKSHLLYGVNANSTKNIVSNCTFEPVSGDTGIEAHIDVGSDCIIANNTVSGGGVSSSLTGGIRVEADDNIVIGNRIINSESSGLTVTLSNDNIIANNRISGSSGSDIENNGTGTVVEGNLTGSAN